MRQLYSVAEVAAKLSLSESTVRRLIASGHLRSVKIGTTRRIPLAALDALVAGDDQPVIPGDHWPPSGALW